MEVYNDKSGKLGKACRTLAWSWLRSRGMTAEDADFAMAGIETAEDFYEVYNLLEPKEKAKAPVRREHPSDTFDREFLNYKRDIEDEAKAHLERIF